MTINKDHILYHITWHVYYCLNVIVIPNQIKNLIWQNAFYKSKTIANSNVDPNDQGFLALSVHMWMAEWQKGRAKSNQSASSLALNDCIFRTSPNEYIVYRYKCVNAVSFVWVLSINPCMMTRVVFVDSYIHHITHVRGDTHRHMWCL